MKRKMNLQLFADTGKNIDTKVETRLEVKNEVNEDVAKLYLYGTIREAYPWEDREVNVISSKRVNSALSGLKGKDIEVHINSGGGDVFESIAISNLLKQHDGDINIHVDGLAGSGASVIAMAGKTVNMPNNAMMMIHKAWTFACGNSDDLRKQADDLDKIDTSVKASYRDRFAGTDDELADLIKDESWLTAEECLAFGFCDSIGNDNKKDTAPENNVKENLFNKYRREPIVADANKALEAKSNLFDKFKGGMNNA